MSEDEGQRFKDLWAWADEDDDEARLPPVAASLVAAVIVVRDAEGWLADQLLALRALTTRPGRLVAVDVGSEDASAALLDEALADGVVDEVVAVDRSTDFAAAVAAGIAETEPEWLWLLHDDSAPEPDALGQLLNVAPTADLLYPKLLAPRRRNYPDVIAEVGQSISGTGHRVGVPEEGEVDQYQVEPGAVLGGSTAGLLIRGDAWRELGGLAPEVPRHRDGVDLGWRANVAGWRVVTAPMAGLVHRGAGRAQERPADDHPHVGDRLAGLRVVGARGAGGLRLLASTWGRALGFLLAKSPAHARAELKAHRRYLATPEATKSLAARIPDGDASEVEDLLAPRYWVARNALDRAGSAVMDRYRDFTEPDTSLDDLTSDEYSGLPSRGRRRLSPAVLFSTLFLVAGVAAGWRLFGSGTVAGGGLLPAPADAGAAWAAYLADGTPWLGIAAVLGSVAFGTPNIASLLLLLLAPVLALWSARSFLHAIGVRPWLAWSGAGLWAAALLALGLPAAGDVSGIVVAVVGPLLARSWWRIREDRSSGAEGLRAPAGAAFWLTLLAAFWPLALPLATLAAVAVLVVRRARVLPWLTAVVPVWLLLAPWLPELLRVPGRWLTSVDPLATPDFPPSSYGLLAGRILPSGVPEWLSVAFFAALGLLALWGILRVRGTVARWLLVGVTSAALLGGVGLSRLAITLGGGQTRALVTAFALVVVAGLIGAIVLGERPREAVVRRPVAGVVAAVLAAAVACAWPFVGFRGPVQTSEPNLPGYVTDVLESPRASRALLIEKTDDALSWNVVDAERPRWGSGERYPAGAFDGEFEELVQAFSGGNVPEDLAQRLQRLAVSHVWLSGFTTDELLSVTNASGVSDAPASDTATIFTVTGLVSRANVVDDGEITPVVEGEIPGGDARRTLVLSEPAGADLTVRVGGEELVEVDGELATYALGEASGELVVATPQLWGALWWSLAMLAVLALLAAPTMGHAAGARRGDEEAA
ncbi:MAG: glycosyltransferase family 2 protein [Propionibacterium sp.]|nr:glycosyltransferase family 2 protein [Propionibacterium sp.]